MQSNTPFLVYFSLKNPMVQTINKILNHFDKISIKISLELEFQTQLLQIVLCKTIIISCN